MMENSIQIKKAVKVQQDELIILNTMVIEKTTKETEKDAWFMRIKILTMANERMTKEMVMVSLNNLMG